VCVCVCVCVCECERISPNIARAAATAVDADANDVSRNKDGSVQANIIAGTVGDVKAKIQPVVPIQYIEFMLEANASYTHNIPKEMETCIVYVYEGEGTFTSKGDEMLARECSSSKK